MMSSQGSSKSGFLGEVGLDFADLVEATESLVVSLPLMPLETGAILHVCPLSPLHNTHTHTYIQTLPW